MGLGFRIELGPHKGSRCRDELFRPNVQAQIVFNTLPSCAPCIRIVFNVPYSRILII